MPTEPNQPAADDVDPEKLSTPAGVTSELEEKAAETGASTEDDDRRDGPVGLDDRSADRFDAIGKAIDVTDAAAGTRPRPVPVVDHVLDRPESGSLGVDIPDMLTRRHPRPNWTVRSRNFRSGGHQIAISVPQRFVVQARVGDTVMRRPDAQNRPVDVCGRPVVERKGSGNANTYMSTRAQMGRRHRCQPDHGPAGRRCGGAGLGTVKSYRLPNSTDPRFVTAASDGNVWFTVQGAFDPVTFNTPGSVARVTPRGAITEFAVCDQCITNDIVQGPDEILYISDNDGQLRRITTSGEVLPSISPCGDVFCSPLDGVAADSTSIWFADFFNNRVGRFNVFAAPGEDPFTYFPAPGVGDVAVAPDGTVWFTGSSSVGEIDPAVGVVSTTPLTRRPPGSRSLPMAPCG